MRGYFNLVWLALFCTATALVASLYYQHVALRKEAAKLIMLQSEYRTFIESIKQYEEADREEEVAQIVVEEEVKKKPFVVVDRSKKYLRDSVVNYFTEKNLGHKLKELDGANKKKPVARKRVSRRSPKRMPSFRFEQDKRFKWPIALKSFWISSFFGKRKNRRTGVVGFHSGIDMAALRGTKVAAADKGKVVEADYRSGYGNTVLIMHDKKYKTRYAHLDKINVLKGDVVSQGQIIGTVGSTGYVRSSGRDASHLHFEVYTFDKAVNPLYVLPW